ncbi:MAG: hypothetical protein SFX72_18335 [Isosphaeraceae bacterium]|nr:hypothetical protein [Isosphaeraceae bacterium]
MTSRIRLGLVVLSVFLTVLAPGCGDENDSAFLKEAGVGEPIKDHEKGYASRKESRQAELDASEKTAKGKRK